MNSLETRCTQDVLKRMDKNYFNRKSLIQICVVSIFVVSLMFAAMLLYTGAIYDPPVRFPNMKIGVLNLDAGYQINGQFVKASSALTYILENVEPIKSSYFDWIIYNSTRDNIIKDVSNGEIWGALIITENYSTTIFIQNNNKTNLQKEIENISIKKKEFYIPTRYSIEYHYDEGRNYNTHNILNKTLVGIVSKLSLSIPLAFIQSIPSQLVTSVDPYFLSYPLNINSFNIHPVKYYGQNFVSFLGVVVCWIAAMSSVVVIGSISHPLDVEKNKASRLSLYGFRFVYGFLFAGFYALLVTIACIIFNEHNNSGLFFLIAWLWIVCVQCFMILLISIFSFENFQIFGTVLLILQLSTSAGFVGEELAASKFYYIGRGLPFYYAVKSMRSILFGSLKSHMGTNIGIILAWTIGAGVLGTILILHRKNLENKKAVNEL